MPFNQQVMKKIVNSINCQCQIVSNGSEMVETYKADPDQIDLILTDFDMPILDGISASI